MFKGGVGGRVKSKYLMLILSSISDKGRGARGQQVQIHFDLPDVDFVLLGDFDRPLYEGPQVNKYESILIFDLPDIDFVLLGKVDRPLYEGSEVKLQGCDAFCTL